MVRVHIQRAASTRPSAARHKASLGISKPSYRVILEQVTQEKKKLITVVSFEATPPPGYTFIPAGDPQLTTRCKQLSREDGVRVLIVSTTPHKHKKDLSQQVHRIGYHFPSYIVDKACMSLGVRLSQSGQVIRRQQVMLAEPRKRSTLKKNRKTRGDRNGSPKSDVSQATLDTQAREAIRDLFPKIPERDLHAIVARAFQKGKDRVGTAAELSLPRRVQLAVVAHIRHVYTNYDKLLKTGSWLEARARIERACLDQLAQWRGDDDDQDTNAMEDILREVIVIPDDDEDDEERLIEFDRDRLADRQQSVEIVSSQALAHEVQTRPVEYSHYARSDGPDRLLSPESEQETGIRYLGPARYGLDDREQRGEDRRGYHRHRAWEEALNRRRRNSNVSHDADNRVPLHASAATARTTRSGYDNVESFWQPETSVQQSHSAYRPQQATAEVPMYLRERLPRVARLLPLELSDSGRRPQVESVITTTQIPISQQVHSSFHHEPLPPRIDRHERAIQVRPPEHHVPSERPRYVLVNSEQPKFADQRNQRPIPKGTGPQSVSMHEPAELRFERVLPSIEVSPRTHLDFQPAEQRERKHPVLDARAPNSPSDRVLRVIDFDQGRDIQRMKRRRVDGQEVNSPLGPGRSFTSPSNDRIFIPIGQSEATRNEEHPARLAAGTTRTVSYMQRPEFTRPLGAANGSDERPYPRITNQAEHEPVAEDRLDLSSAFQYLPPSVRFRRSLVEAEGPIGRPLSHSQSDYAPAERFHELSQSAVSYPRELGPSHYGVSTPYVSSRRYGIAPLNIMNGEICEEPTKYEPMVMERDYPQRVHEGPAEGAEVLGERNIYDEPRLEEHGQVIYIPVQQEQGTPRMQHRPRTRVPFERPRQGLQSMTELSQSGYEDAVHAGEEHYRRVAHPTQAVQVESRPYPNYDDGSVEVRRSAVPRAGEQHSGFQGARPEGQRTGTPPPRQHRDGRYSNAVPIQMLERPRSRGKTGVAQYGSEGREQFVRRAPREIIVLE